MTGPVGAAATALERGLAGLWATVLDRSGVEITEPFALLGGDRVLAAELTNQVREVFGVDIASDALFTDAATVREMAIVVRAVQQCKVPRIRPLSAGLASAPLSSGQQRLWVMDQFIPENPFYNVPVMYWLQGELDLVALGKAIAALVERHDILRSRIEAPDGVPAQIVCHDGIGDLVVEDIGGPETDRRERALRRATEEVRRPFTLELGPLARTLLLKLNHGTALLVMATHHIAMDGWSKEILVRELSVLYQAARERRPCTLPPIPIRYQDYAVWQREWLRSEQFERELRWWHDRLDSVPTVLPLRTDLKRPKVASFSGAAVGFMLSPAAVEALRGLGREHGATLFIVLLTAVHALLSVECGVQDVVVGVPTTGRSRPEVNGIVGFFINTLVVRADCSGDPSFRLLLSRVRDATLGAYAHQDVPFDHLVREFDQKRDLSRNPLAQVLVQLEPEDPILEFPDVAATHVDNVEGGVRADLEIHFHDGPQQLRGQLVYATDLFVEDTAQGLVDRLIRLLCHVAEDPEQRLSTLMLI